MLTFPKDNAQFSWTRHIKNKMVFYHLSGAQLLRIFRSPDRKEEGIAPDTIAAMKAKKAVGAKVGRSEEIWLMYKMNKGQRTKDFQQKTNSSIPSPRSLVLSSKSRITMISAWRYPGTTKVGERPIIPPDVLEAIQGELE